MYCNPLTCFGKQFVDLYYTSLDDLSVSLQQSKQKRRIALLQSSDMTP